MELFAGSQAVIKFNRRWVQLANQKLYARRVAIADIKQNKGNRRTVWRGSKRRVVPSSGRNPLVPGTRSGRGKGVSYSKSVRLHALHTNYETRPAIAVHCYLICPRRRAALPRPRSRFTFHVVVLVQSQTGSANYTLCAACRHRICREAGRLDWLTHWLRYKRLST